MNFVLWPLPIRWRQQAGSNEDTRKRNPYDSSTWGASCGMGFVSDERFGTGQVIKRTNRVMTRKNRQASQAVKP